MNKVVLLEMALEILQISLIEKLVYWVLTGCLFFDHFLLGSQAFLGIPAARSYTCFPRYDQ